MTEQEHPWETVPEQDAVPETSPAENTDTPDTPIAVSNPDAVLPPDEPTEPDGLKPSDLEPAAISAEPVPESVPRKQLGKLFWESFCMVFPPVLLVVALGLVAYYIICPAKGEFHADCTDTIYWAKATFDSGKLISPDFSYACLLPFGGSLLMLLFLPFFGLSMTTHMLGMLLFFLLLTAVLCWMLREMHWDYRWICTTAAIFLMILSASKKLREIFWGHTIYYSLGILFLFCGLALLFRLQNLVAVHQETRKIRVHSILTFIALILFFVLCCTDQVTAVTIFALPILAGLFLERLLDRKTPLLHWKNTRALLLLLSLGIAVVSGMELGNIWANGVTGAYADAYSNWTAQSTWTEHLQKLPLAWLTLLGLEDIPGEKLMSGESVMNLIENVETTGNIYGVEKPSYGQDGTDVLVYIGEVAAIKVPEMAKHLLALLAKAGVSAKVLANEPASGVMLGDLIGSIVHSCAISISVYDIRFIMSVSFKCLFLFVYIYI
mgnify:CR=1 FL=1